MKPAAAATLPRQLGRYEIMRKIASGGMASVYLGRTIYPKDFHRVVAIKLVHPHLDEDPKFREMLLYEARLAARIRHPNVVQTVDVGVEGELYLVMDYVDGASLAELLKRAREQDKQLPIDVIAAILLDTLRGLEAAHTATDESGKPLEVIHRDVSPQNLLVGRDGITRVADFGVAKAAQANPVTTKTGEVKGKLSYISPEQLSTTEAVTTRADIFAVGIVAWELLEGERLFTGDTYAGTVQRVLYVPIPKVESAAALAHPKFVDAVEGALQRDPAQRIESAKELCEQIEASGVPVATRAQVAACVVDLLGEPEVNAEEELATAIYEDKQATRKQRRRRLVALSGVLTLTALGLILGIRAMAVDTRSSAEAKGRSSAVVGSVVESPPTELGKIEEVFVEQPRAEEAFVEPLSATDAAQAMPDASAASRQPRKVKKRRRPRKRRRRAKTDSKSTPKPLYDPETI